MFSQHKSKPSDLYKYESHHAEEALWKSRPEPTTELHRAVKVCRFLLLREKCHVKVTFTRTLFERPGMKLQDKTQCCSPSESVVKHSSKQHHPLTYFWSRLWVSVGTDIKYSPAALIQSVAILRWFSTADKIAKIQAMTQSKGGERKKICFWCVCQSLSESSAVWLEPAKSSSKATAAMKFWATVEVEVEVGPGRIFTVK